MRTTPTFTVEPQSSVMFSNKFGAVIPCVIDAYSTNLKVTWIVLVGDTYIEASDVLGLRLIREDGSLCFPPFIDSQYNANIHNTAYKCVGQTPYGTIGSREVRVKAGKSCLTYLCTCFLSSNHRVFVVLIYQLY
jgi:hypothetical protein